MEAAGSSESPLLNSHPKKHPSPITKIIVIIIIMFMIMLILLATSSRTHTIFGIRHDNKRF